MNHLGTVTSYFNQNDTKTKHCDIFFLVGVYKCNFKRFWTQRQKNQGLKKKTKKGLEQKKHPQELFKDYIFKPPHAENILVFPTSNL